MGYAPQNKIRLFGASFWQRGPLVERQVRSPELADEWVPIADDVASYGVHSPLR